MTKTLRGKAKLVKSVQGSPTDNRNSELYARVADYALISEKQQSELNDLQA